MSWLAAIFTSPGRSKADRLHDTARRAEDTISAADLRSDQSILEIEPGKGWFTGILLELVSQSGALMAQQPVVLDPFFGKDARNRIRRSGQSNAQYSDAPWEWLEAGDATVDRVVWLQGPHEMWFQPEPGVSFGDPDKVFAEVARVLKSGGQFVVVDNLAPDDASPEQAGVLHRSVPKALAQIGRQAGLELVTEDLNWIASDIDPRDQPTYDPKIHLKTHQFLQVYRKD